TSSPGLASRSARKSRWARRMVSSSSPRVSPSSRFKAIRNSSSGSGSSPLATRSERSLQCSVSSGLLALKISLKVRLRFGILVRWQSPEGIPSKKEEVRRPHFTVSWRGRTRCSQPSKGDQDDQTKRKRIGPLDAPPAGDGGSGRTDDVLDVLGGD